jgi:MATE family multidrug resistance protein
MKELFNLILPVVLTYLGIMLMGIVDIIFVGHIDAAAIGAVGVGTSLFAWFLVFGMGMSNGMEYLISRAHGAKEVDKLCQYLVQGVLLSLLGGVPLTILLVWISFHLDWFGINPEVLAQATTYSVILGTSLISAYVFNVQRLFLSAMGIAKPPMVALLLGNIFNAGVDYALVLGHWGFPRLGAEGAAWATLSSRTLMVAGLGIGIGYWNRKNHNPLSKVKFSYNHRIVKEIVKIGLPSALQMTFEVGVFAVVTTLAARLSVADLAAHQIVLNTASLTFMVPLGVGSATAILVGQAMGRKENKLAVRLGWQGFALGVGFMAVSSATLLCFADWILGFYTTDAQVIAVGKSIILVAAFFQLSDGTQTVGTGALRGLGDTHSSMYFNLAGHWLIGLPVGVALCFHWGLGLKGLWMGLSLGLTVVAIAILVRWVFVSRKVV